MAITHAPPPPPFLADPSGTRYETGPCMGKGGFAICHAAERWEGKKATGHLVALKIVKTHIKPEKLAQKFVTELQIHSKLAHPNIVKFYRAFTIEEHTYVVLELCPNNSLADLLRRRKTLTLPEIRRIVIQLCGAVKYLHDRHIVHRDLKTGNIMLDDNLNVKVGDFGLAALLVTPNDMAVQRRTTMCGTPNYLAPEILEKGNGHDERVDLWAIGIILYTLAVGTAPFHATTKEMIYQNLRNGAYTWPELKSSTNQSADLRDLVSNMLVPEQDRLIPDQIVSHNFFKTAFVPTTIPESALDTPPSWPEVSIPSAQDVRRGYTESWFNLCKESGVGEYAPDKFFRIKHGGKRVRSVVHDMAREIQSTTQPTLPLPSFTIYKSPVCDWDDEGLAAPQGSEGETRAKNRKLMEISHNAVSNTRKPISTTQKAQRDAQLMPPPPLPTSAAPPNKAVVSRRAARTISEETAKTGSTVKVSQDEALAPITLPKRRNVPQDVPPVLRNSNTISSKSRSSTEQKPSSTDEDAKPVRASSVKRSADAALARRPRATTKDQQRATSPGGSTPPLQLPKRASPNKRSKQRHAVEDFDILPDPEPVAVTRPVAEFTRTRPVKDTARSTNARRPARPEGDAISSQTKSVAQRPLSTNDPNALHNSEPASVQLRLRSFRKNLDASLQNTLHARNSSAQAQNLPFVTRWVDYHQKHGFGYALADGTVGCIINRVGKSHPVTHVVVRRGRKWLKQIGPNFEGVDDVPFEIYEDCGDQGLKRKVYKGLNGVESGPLLAESERRHELGVLWFKFGRYMSNHLDGDEKETEEPSIDFVRLYQRIGGVNVYYMTNGCMQIQFPDHTKLVINAAGTHMSALCLTPEAGEHLEERLELQPQHYSSRELFADTISAMLHGEDCLPPGYREANDLQMKVEFVRGVVNDWIELNGLGIIRQNQEWRGQSTADGIYQRQMVTVGRYGGD